MEEFKKKLQNRRIACLVMSAAALMVLAALMLELLLVGDVSGADGSFSDGMKNGFRVSLTVLIGLMGAIQWCRYGKTLRDEKALRLLYNRENDERLIWVRSRAGMPLIFIASLLMIAAAVIAGYFSTVVFYTLLVTGTVQLLMAAAVKMYYLKKTGA